jgi:hypothetical protein
LKYPKAIVPQAAVDNALIRSKITTI